jgi:outer membrane protein TolC
VRYEGAAFTHQRYTAGTVTPIALLDAEHQQINAAQDLSIAEAGLTGNLVAIQKALGLGWAPPA